MVESEQLKLPSHLPYVQPYTVAIMQTNRVSHDSYNVHGLFDTNAWDYDRNVVKVNDDPINILYKICGTAL